jgi:ribosome-associated protein
MTATIPESELQFDYIRSAGPGGQNVNKVATAVQLRFDVGSSGSIPAEIKERLIRMAGKRMTADGVLVIEAKRYRTQEQNRADAMLRLQHLIEQASTPPKPRRSTRPSFAEKAERLADKKKHSELKRSRGERFDKDA